MFSILYTVIVLTSNGNVAVSTQMIGKFNDMKTCAIQQKRLLESDLVTPSAAKYQTAQCVLISDLPFPKSSDKLTK